MILASLSSCHLDRRALYIGALVLVVASSAAMSQVLSVRADDERDAVANAAAEAEATVNALQSQLEGIDASLAQVFIDLQAPNGQIPVAQAAYKSTAVTYNQKAHEHTTVMSELNAAQGEQSRTGQSLDQATTQAGDTQRAIADPVCRKYHGGNVDPVMVVLTVSGTEPIIDRATAAGMTLHTKSQTMTVALDVPSPQRAQTTRQDATTERITDPEVKAAQAEEGARQAKDEADAKPIELNSLKEQAQTKQAEWGAQKSQVEAFLSQAETDYQTRSAELAAIGATNRVSGASYASVPGFRNPLGIPVVMTFPFGMHCHPVLGVMRGYLGTDMAADYGTVIRAVTSDYVNVTSSDVSAGNHMDTNHDFVGGNSVITGYLYTQAQYASSGQYVNAGDALGEVGLAGYAMNCHLRFGILQDGSYVEPMDYL